VLDAFTRGGAQRAGGQHTRAVNAASDLDLRAGHPLLPRGLEFTFLRVRADDTTNYLHLHLEAGGVRAGAPAQLHAARRRSDIRYNNLQGGLLRTTCGCDAT
jgi:hypothetical protein